MHRDDLRNIEDVVDGYAGSEYDMLAAKHNEMSRVCQCCQNFEHQCPCAMGPTFNLPKQQDMTPNPSITARPN